MAVQGMAWQGAHGPMRVYYGSLQERWKRLRISAIIYLLRTSFWLVSCTTALWEGANTRLFDRDVDYSVKDKDTLTSV